MVLSRDVTAARSMSPSASKSPATTAVGLDSAVISLDAEKPPSPSPLSTLMVWLPWFATARSRCPSPFRSAAAMPLGEAPVGKNAAGPREPVPSPM